MTECETEERKKDKKRVEETPMDREKKNIGLLIAHNKEFLYSTNNTYHRPNKLLAYI